MSNKVIGTALILICSLSGGPIPVLKPYESVEPHMGTMFRIKLYSADAELASKAFRAAFDRITQLDNELSDYKPDSELNVATKSAASQPVQLSKDLATVLKASLEISEETDGAFDVTVGPLSKLWRTARKQGKIPTAQEIVEARQRCGYQKLHLEQATNILRVDLAGMQLDLGGIAKGYAADEALAVLAGMGLKQALVAASGDLAFGDAPPDQGGWKIGVDSLDKADKPFTRVLLLQNAAVSTSGGTEQFLEANHQKYSHIIDPKTGMGLTTDISVTTVSRHGIRADPAATAVSVLGCEKGMAFIEHSADLAGFVLEKNHAMESNRFASLTPERR